MTMTDRLRALPVFATPRRRLVAILTVAVLVVGSTTAFAVGGKVTADEQAHAKVVAAQELESQRVHNYLGALKDLQPAGAQLVSDATAWAGSGSPLLRAEDILALQSTADDVSGSLARVPAAHATSAELKKLFDSQSGMVNGARQRVAHVISSAAAVAQAHLATGPIADATTRQTLIDALAALAAAAKNHSSIATHLATLTAAASAVDAAQAAAVAAQAAAAAAAAAAQVARRHSGGGGGGSEVLRLVNIERANAGVAALKQNSGLTSASQACANRMAAANSMTHSPAAVPAGFHTWGENIAQGYGSAAAVVAGWMGSSGHRANILNPAFTSMGIGYVASGNWWCQQFAG